MMGIDLDIDLIGIEEDVGRVLKRRRLRGFRLRGFVDSIQDALDLSGKSRVVRELSRYQRRNKLAA